MYVPPSKKKQQSQKAEEECQKMKEELTKDISRMWNNIPKFGEIRLSASLIVSCEMKYRHSSYICISSGKGYENWVMYLQETFFKHNDVILVPEDVKCATVENMFGAANLLFPEIESDYKVHVRYTASFDHGSFKSPKLVKRNDEIFLSKLVKETIALYLRIAIEHGNTRWTEKRTSDTFNHPVNPTSQEKHLQLDSSIALQDLPNQEKSCQTEPEILDNTYNQCNFNVPIGLYRMPYHPFWFTPQNPTPYIPIPVSDFTAPFIFERNEMLASEHTFSHNPYIPLIPSDAICNNMY